MEGGRLRALLRVEPLRDHRQPYQEVGRRHPRAARAHNLLVDEVDVDVGAALARELRRADELPEAERVHARVRPG